MTKDKRYQVQFKIDQVWVRVSGVTFQTVAGALNYIKECIKGQVWKGADDKMNYRVVCSGSPDWIKFK